MISARVFVCYESDNEALRSTSLFNLQGGDQGETHLLQQVYSKLQEAGAEVVLYPGSPSDDGFFPFLHQELPDCQWFLLFQTPAAIRSWQVRMATNIALDFVRRGKLQVLRLIATSTEGEDLPSEWSALPSFDATRDPLRAQEKLLLALSGDVPIFEAETVIPPPPVDLVSPGPLPPFPGYEQALQEARAIVPPPAGSFNPGPLPLLPDYDRPHPPSRLSLLQFALTDMYEDTMRNRTGRTLMVCIPIFLVVLLVGGLLVNALVVQAAQAKIAHGAVKSTPTAAPVKPTPTSRVSSISPIHTGQSTQQAPTPIIGQPATVPPASSSMPTHVPASTPIPTPMSIAPTPTLAPTSTLAPTPTPLPPTPTPNVYAQRMPLYRLLNSTTGFHLYTMSTQERDLVVAQNGYHYETIAGYLFPTQVANTQPLYRLNNPKGDHFYTMSTQERDSAVSQYGYHYEGIMGYLYVS
ncbi:MAG TPA: hypothetical protein VL485_24070 [Ktedonobacteraceae bacterium]|jgi:hypothetical protein|nr:hypothetical protein [Ktedonobacteraceae bacterium]